MDVVPPTYPPGHALQVPSDEFRGIVVNIDASKTTFKTSRTYSNNCQLWFKEIDDVEDEDVEEVTKGLIVLYSISRAAPPVTFVLTGMDIVNNFQALPRKAQVRIIPARSLRSRLRSAKQSSDVESDITCFARSIRKARISCWDPKGITTQVWKLPGLTYILDTMSIENFSEGVTRETIRANCFVNNSDIAKTGP